jgi:hypothetical protein
LGKRSDFERLPRDYYRTIDPRAVQALKPFIEENQTFIEPCAGDGILTDQLVEVLKLKCVAEYDIEPDHKRILQKDALTLTESDVIGVDIIASNPPWDRKLLHPLIERFATLRPTWLLFDANWVWTKQSSRFITSYCTDIVAIGRLKWIENTTMSGKDDNAWFRFDINKQGSTKFHGR